MTSSNGAPLQPQPTKVNQSRKRLRKQTTSRQPRDTRDEQILQGEMLEIHATLQDHLIIRDGPA
jgi:hypothetical protein